jgi:hypothetical protein
MHDIVYAQELFQIRREHRCSRAAVIANDTMRCFGPPYGLMPQPAPARGRRLLSIPSDSLDYPP